MSQPEELLDLPPVFVDRALDSPRFTEPLKEAQIRIGHITGRLVIHCHNDLFDQGTSDEEWIECCGRNGWIVFTKDKAIRRRQLEREAVQKYNAAVFNLKTQKNMTAQENAQAFVKAVPRISQFLRRYSPPFIAKISRDGSVEMDLDL